MIRFALIALALSFSAAPRLHTFHHENVLGTSLELKVLSGSARDAAAAERAVLGEIDRLARILSAYDPSSEFSRWNKTRNVSLPISLELFDVLSLFDQWRERTGGALDPSAMAAIEVWKRAAAAGHTPSESELGAARAAIRAEHWRLDPIRKTAARLSSTPLILNSFTKLYIAGKAAEKPRGVNGVVVNIGGDIVVRGRIDETVRVADPRNDAEGAGAIASVTARNQAVATSGDYRRGFDIAGRHYSHIVDPRTAQPAGHVASATVIADDPATAGALATAFNVMPIEESRALAESIRGVRYLVVSADGERSGNLQPNELTLHTAWQAPAAEVVVNLELARIDEPRFRRPYVAVWIEDKDKFPIRTVGLWLGKTRWLPDLKAWYRADRLRALAEGNEILGSVSSATRPPGKYTLKWDGKDAAGKAVKPGKYTVAIEAAREHGTYQITRQEIDLTGPAKHFDLAANTEIASASIDFRR